MPKIVWWQFSDLHWPAKPAPEQRAFAKQLLTEIQGQVLSEHGAPDLLFFTGDIAFSGNAQEYESAEQAFFGPLRQIVGETIPLFIVPGNHDFSRLQADNLNADRVNAISTATQLDAFLDDRRSRQIYMTPFDDFSSFAARHVQSGCRDVFSWQIGQEIKGTTLQIAGLNSAWSSYYPIRAGADTDDRHLLIGASQLPDADPKASYRILIMHHPFDWMNRELCSRVEQNARHQFDIILFGHVHSPRDLSLLTTPGSNCLLVPSPLLYSRPYDDSIEFARGFVIGTLELGTGLCEVHYYRYADAYGSPKLVPYLDLYPTGADRFAAPLKPILASHESASHVQASPEARLPDVAIASDFSHDVRCYFDKGVNAASIRHCLAIFAELVGFLAYRSPVFSAMHIESAIAAYLATELVIVRRLDENDANDGRMRFDAAYSAFVRLRPILPSISHSDFSLLCAFINDRDLATPQRLTSHVVPANHHASLLFSVLWSLGRYVLALDYPKSGDSADQSENVIGVRSTEEGVLVVRVATTTRDGFHRIAEARHEVDEYVSEVEDLWRRAGLIAPPISLRVEFPMWRQRSLDSFYLQVEAKPIARLLMGKALYGTREHVWIRELLQNAIDATEMRRTTLGEASYQAKVGIKLSDGNHVDIYDNGVGMDRQHVVRYLATLGRSGWRVNDGAPIVKVDASFFGRFGIGFASVFNVARAVHVSTRRVGSRSVDGLSVQFSDPERPYFVEPLVCPEGTSIGVTLIDQMSSASFRKALSDLFVYLPPFLEVNPEAGLPASLDKVSIAEKFPNHFEQTARTVLDVMIGAYRARLAVELGVPPIRRKVVGREMPTSTPSTALTLAVNGIRIFEQEGLRIDSSGRPKAEVDWQWRRIRDYGLKNCFATLDFERETSPVTPSRDAIDVEPAFSEQLKVSIEEQVVGLMQELLGKLRTDEDEEARRAAFMRILESVSKEREYWEEPGQLGFSDQVLKRIAKLYFDECPVMLRTDKGEHLLRTLSAIEPASCSTAVLDKINETSSFSVYARVAGLRSWIVVGGSTELGILQAAWPFSPSLRTIASSSNLFQRYEMILPELRTMKLCRLIRGDYALSDSPIFEGSLFVHVPSNVQPVARHVGAARRRSQMDTSQVPRVVLNASHKLTVGLEDFLSKADEKHIQQLGTWLDSFCDGVIEDKTKLAPTARWNRLIEDLKDLTGIDLRGTSIEKLRLTV